MPQVKDISQAYTPTKEISLEEILRMHGVPSASQEALQYSSPTNEIIQRYIYDPLKKKGRKDLALSAANAAKMMAAIAPLAWGLSSLGMGEEAAAEASPIFEQAIQQANDAPAPVSVPRTPGGPTSLPLGRQYHATVPYHADYMGTTRPLRWNELSPFGQLDPNDPVDVAHLARIAREPRIDPLSESPSPPPRYGFGPSPPYPPRPEVARPRVFERPNFEDYHYSIFDRPTQEAVPVRSLPPYEEYRRWSGNRPTSGLSGGRGGALQEILSRTRRLGQGVKEASPTGMFDRPKPLEFHGEPQMLGESYVRETASQIPREHVQPGLVVYRSPGPDNEIHLVYYGPDKKPVAAATGWARPDGGINVSYFGADLSKGIVARRGATEVGAALWRMKPRGGAMSQYSRGMLAKVREAMANPMLRKAFYKTRPLNPSEIPK